MDDAVFPSTLLGGIQDPKIENRIAEYKSGV